MAPPDERVLRLRRSDVDGDAFVLLNVTSSGSQSLDLKLLGTDGENVYVASIQQSRIHKLRAVNYDGPKQEWEAALTKTLLGKAVQDGSTALGDLELVASIPSANELTVVWRRDIKGITQRLGSLALQQTDDEEIELFDWAGVAAQHALASQQEVECLDGKLREQQEAVSKLKNQLEDLIKAKSEHEDALLQKFASLINSKKLKIRDQQRLLATAKVDQSIAQKVRGARDSNGPAEKQRPGASRKGKRKAEAEPEPDEEKSDDGFEEMPVDDPKEREEREELIREQETPQPTDDETESEEEQPKEQTVDRGSTRGKLGGKGEGKKQEKEAESQPAAWKENDNDQEPEAPPPRRELPFAKRSTKANSEAEEKRADPPAAAPPDDDETEDDEL